MITSKLDPESLLFWERLQRTDKIPTYEQVTEFLYQRGLVPANAPLNKLEVRAPTARRNNTVY